MIFFVRPECFSWKTEDRKLKDIFWHFVRPKVLEIYQTFQTMFAKVVSNNVNKYLQEIMELHLQYQRYIGARTVDSLLARKMREM